MSTFNEADVRRGPGGRFAEKPAAPEAGGVVLAESHDYARFDAVSDRYDQVSYDNLDDASRAADEVAQAGYIGVVHVERHHTSEGVYEGEIDYASEDHEVRVFESEAQLAKWSNESGMSPQEERSDIHSSVDEYPHPYKDDIESHEAYVHRPAVAATDRVPHAEVVPGALAEGDHVLHEGRAQRVYSVEDEDGHVAVELEDEIVYPDAGARLTRLNLPAAD